VETKTLKDQGYNLPLGLLKDGSLRKPFTFKPYTMAEDKAIARRIDSFGDGAPESVKVSFVLSQLLINLGGEDVSELEQGKRDLKVFGLGFGDIMYAYLMARVESLGPEVRFPSVCPWCEQAFTFDGDLLSVEVLTTEDPTELTKVVDLSVPWKVRGISATRVLLRPTPWGICHGKSVTPAEFQAQMYQGAIIGVDDKDPGSEDPITEIAMSPLDIDTLPKRLVNELDGAVNDLNGGPRLRLTTKCPHDGCGRPVTRPLPWGFDSFFG